MKSYTDIEQSKKLAEILPIESADSHYVRNTHDFMGNPVDGKWSHPKYGNPDSKYAHYVVQNFSNYEIIPCWSLTALLNVLPNKLQIALAINDFQGDRKEKYAIGSVEHDKYDCFADNSVDACYELIIKLHELKML